MEPALNSRIRRSAMARKRRGFTMVEMLVVIAIIAILASLILTGLNVARARAKVIRARRDVAQLMTVWTAYYADYSRFPEISTDSRLGENLTDTVVTGLDVVQIMRGRENFNSQNPRRIAYMDFHRNTTQFLDPWGNSYRIVWDDDYDGEITVPGGASLRMSVAVWSAGPDETDGTVDDVRSWRPE